MHFPAFVNGIRKLRKQFPAFSGAICACYDQPIAGLQEATAASVGGRRTKARAGTETPHPKNAFSNGALISRRWVLSGSSTDASTPFFIWT